MGYGVLHSLLAGNATKNWISRRTGGFFRFYRLFYNLIAVAGLIAIVYYQSGIPEARLMNRTVLSGTGWLVMVAGSLIIVAALLKYNLKEFAGLDAFGKTARSTQLRQDGLLQKVRHPLYLGIYLTMWGYFLTLPLPSTLLMVVVLSLYIRIGIYFEEQKLIQEFGEQYETYRKKVPMLWPKRG
jgi:protein-S-isoprenylcysteine O-methyltransferase Ste14